MSDFVIFVFGLVVTIVSLAVTVLLVFGATEDAPE